jgi:hypothetical protein
MHREASWEYAVEPGNKALSVERNSLARWIIPTGAGHKMALVIYQIIRCGGEGLAAKGRQSK